MWYFSGKANHIPQNGFNLKFSGGSILEIGFEATFKSKTNVLDIWIWIFWGFFTFFSEQKENVLRKARQGIQNWVNPKSVIENVLENCLKTTLRSKVDLLLNLWNKKLSVSCTSLSQEVETAYCESKAKRSKVFKSKVGYGKHFRKKFRSNPVKP